LACSVQAKTLL